MTNHRTDNSGLIEDEWYAVRYSGEIPEVALQSSLYHLCEDEEGPGLELSDEQIAHLLDAVRQRYIDIILRDLLPANRQTSSYRGVKRAICNWNRYLLFCRRYDFDGAGDKEQVARALLHFLAREIEDMRHPDHRCCINCSYQELRGFSEQLGLCGTEHLSPLADHCP